MNIFFNFLYKQRNYVFYWLFCCALMVLSMVVIGGITRLTNSGLSTVEWKPITGIIPPLSESDWNIEFSKYQASPEFNLINNTMDLQAFKAIFWLEFLHRFAGRLMGLAFFIPAAFFWYYKKLMSSTKKAVILMSLLYFSQGFMGWYMVKSGLAGDPYVSHFRLTLHLLLALAIFAVSLNEGLRLYYSSHYKEKLDPLNHVCLALTIIQIALGGLVAGLDAGLVYPTFPLMGEHIYPEEIFTENLFNSLSNPVLAQFFHRINACILSLLVFYIGIKELNNKNYNSALILTLLIIFQFALGIFTLIFQVPVFLASMHQLFAFILFGFLIIISRKIQTK